MKGLPRITEKQFQQMVIDLARLRGWKVYHTHNSRHSAKGFPDLVLVRPIGAGRPVGRMIFAELKREDGKLTEEQKEWLSWIMGANQAYFVWRPSDWSEIEKVLE